MEERVSFVSEGLKLAGVLHVPDDGRGPKSGAPPSWSCTASAATRTAATAPPPRRCSPASVMRRSASTCAAAVRARARAAASSASSRSRTPGVPSGSWRRGPEIDPDRIGVIGASFGAAVAVYTAGIDPRVAACISAGGWGDGEKKFRKQHESPEPGSDSAPCSRRAGAARRRASRSWSRATTSCRFRRPCGATSRRARSWSFRSTWSRACTRSGQRRVGKISPPAAPAPAPGERLRHADEQSIDLFRHAGQPTDLHLVAGVDHFVLSESNTLVVTLVRNWLDKHFPVAAGAR